MISWSCALRWTDAASSSIDWTMSAALENVVRGGTPVPEVTSLEAAVRAWIALDPAARSAAVLTLERPVKLTGGMPLDNFLGDAIGDLADRLPD